MGALSCLSRRRSSKTNEAEGEGGLNELGAVSWAEMTVIAAPVWSELITIAAGDLVDGAAEISNRAYPENLNQGFET